jgi:hypothetical protein
VTVQMGVKTHEALLRLRAHAYATDRDLDEVCRDVLAGRLRIHADM